MSDGQQLWIYYPKFQSAEHYSLGKHSPLDAGIAALTAALNLDNVENSYHITAHKLEQGYELQLVPRNPSLKRLLKTFTVQMNADLEVRRTEMDQPNGDHIVTIYANESRAPIPPATFEFTPAARNQRDQPARSLATKEQSCHAARRAVSFGMLPADNPEISVIIPVANEAAALPLCLARINGVPNEIIVVDAGAKTRAVRSPERLVAG